jgi:hypothetical protein
MSESSDTMQSGGADDDWAEDLTKAIEKAWNKKVQKNGGEQTYYVDKIWIKGTNPISGYRVVLGP